MTATAAAARPTVVLTDIEGTTSAISFVKDTLFPFARAALEDFLRRRGGEPAVAEQLAEVRRLQPGREVAEVLRGWMDEDAKVTPLKALQGMIWQEGYAAGRLQAHFYPDVVPALRSWSRSGVELCVYSSGSVEAQRLLFGHSEAGDLTPLFHGFFDTRVGAKRESESYRRIAAGLHRPAGEILFLSDVAEELDAAREAGMQCCQLVRAEDGTRPSGRHAEASSFPEVAARFGLPGAEMRNLT
ncbi:acireductone synthase [Roseomonas elaeocarpi]|uniref:Enolase-phosphatase E1 n=1 Tax=Roseomonas elaeocarpi TaxID=907779 RepID=A0ABV6JQ45_9PROT